MPELSGQKPRNITTDYTWSLYQVPLLITRKKLPQNSNDDLRTIARNWGFVSMDDANQALCYNRLDSYSSILSSSTMILVGAMNI